MASSNHPSSHNVPPPLSHNPICYLGWAVVITSSTLLAVLAVMGIFFYRDNPYNSLVTYLILPGFLGLGVVLIFAGILLEWRRRHKAAPVQYPPLPVVDINVAWLRRRVVLGLVLLTLFFSLSAIGTYQAYHFTESTVFCGRICHQVMRPEYTAYHYSPHARVACTECHIGPGASWFVKSKLSGLYQVWAVLTHSYHLPIETPIKNLRPARQTCEECHWPDKFSSSMEKVVWHFAPDQVNTPYRYNMLLKVGGGSPEIGLGHGIHWHINPTVKVRYWPRDFKRLDIPWVEVTQGDSPPRVYRSPDGPDPLPQDAQIRTMDCMDCHNRPSHIYRSPIELIDDSMGRGILDASLPYLKRYATEALERTYPDTPTALSTIAIRLGEKYQDWQRGESGKTLVENNVKLLQTLYQRNFFPEQKVSWAEYPNHIGHYEFPGCFRCHNDRHQSSDGRKISNDCSLCHEFLDQAEGQAAYGPVIYKIGPYRHPLNMPEVWKGHNCTDCHGPNAPEAAKKIKPSQTAAALPASHP